jgi:putative addiction module killer protein
VYEIRQTPGFQKWLGHLPDRTAKARLIRRIERLAHGYPGDTRYLGASLHELREHFGPGYRIYFTDQAGRLVLLLAGGDKNSQRADIARARALIERLETDR